MHRQIPWRLHLNVLLGVILLISGALAAQAAEPKQATFEITNLYTVKAPQQAQTMRIWFAVPQEDAESTIQNLDVEAPYEIRYGVDSQGNRVGYVEIQEPKSDVTIREAFQITRREILGNVDPAQTRPLTEAEKTEMADALKPSTYVLVNDEMKALAAQIVGDEDNPIQCSAQTLRLDPRQYRLLGQRPRASQGISSGQHGVLLAHQNGQLHGFSRALHLAGALSGPALSHRLRVASQAHAERHGRRRQLPLLGAVLRPQPRLANARCRRGGHLCQRR